MPTLSNFKVNGYISRSCFSATFTKGNNFCDFLFAFPDNKTIPKWDLFLKEKLCSYGSKFCPSQVDPTEMGSKIENSRAGSTENVSGADNLGDHSSKDAKEIS